MISSDKDKGDVVNISPADLLPSLTELRELKLTLASIAAVVRPSSSQPAPINEWLSGVEVDALAEKIANAILAPSGPDILLAILPSLIYMKKKAENQVANLENS